MHFHLHWQNSADFLPLSLRATFVIFFDAINQPAYKHNRLFKIKSWIVGLSRRYGHFCIQWWVQFACTPSTSVPPLCVYASSPMNRQYHHSANSILLSISHETFLRKLRTVGIIFLFCAVFRVESWINIMSCAWDNLAMVYGQWAIPHTGFHYVGESLHRDPAHGYPKKP